MNEPGLADELVSTGLVTDPFVDGRLRFRRRPHRISSREQRQLARAAERVASVYNELCRLGTQQPQLVADFLGLSPTQRLLWGVSAPLWHGIARADVFLCDEHPEPVVCELNCDTPSGLTEAVVLGRLARQVPGAHDPGPALEAAFVGLVRRFAARQIADRTTDTRLSVGLVYPTEMTDDLGLVRLYQGWAERQGWRVTLGAPFNLTPTSAGAVSLFGQPCDVVIRHYKTDWWGERAPVWLDEAPFPDPDPLDGPIACVLRAALSRRCAVINPLGAVLPQNKRAMAFMWEEIGRFSSEAQQVIRAHVPESIRLERADHGRLRAERAQWVIKSDYGCEGDEVVLGRDVTDDEWASLLARALPGRWIAQRYFHARVDEEEVSANHGVFLVAGRATGLYVRLARGATDPRAISAPVEVVP